MGLFPETFRMMHGHISRLTNSDEQAAGVVWLALGPSILQVLLAAGFCVLLCVVVFSRFSNMVLFL